MKRIYLLLVQLIAEVTKRQSPKYKIAYFMSFRGNEAFIRKLTEKFGIDNVLLVYEPEMADDVKHLIHSKHIVHQLQFGKFQLHRFIWGVRAASTVIFDNYYPELSAIKKRPCDYFIQLWHANGAIKSFGWEDPTTYHRSKDDQKRFQKVYDSFDQVVVGSDYMADVFKKSWHLPDAKITKIGYPRSDQFFDAQWVKNAQTKLQERYPNLKEKRIILYAPTYRKNVTFEWPADFSELKIPKNAVMVIRLHPHLAEMEKEIDDLNLPNVITVDADVQTADLLCIADTLVTDYSSIAFDFSLLDNAKSLIFFTYDLLDFESKVGLQPSFKHAYQDYFIKDTKTLNYALKTFDSRSNILNRINQNWNSLNDGHASQRLISKIIQHLEVH